MTDVNQQNDAGNYPLNHGSGALSKCLRFKTTREKCIKGIELNSDDINNCIEAFDDGIKNEIENLNSIGYRTH